MVDALSRQPYPALSYLLALSNDFCEEFQKLELNVITPMARPMLCTLEVQPTRIEKIRVAQGTDPQLKWIREEILVGKAPGFVIYEDGTIWFHDPVCVPIVEALKKKILDEGHNTPHSVHPWGNKLYKDLKQTLWWSNMKHEVANYVAKCLTYQGVKIEHH